MKIKTSILIVVGTIALSYAQTNNPLDVGDLTLETNAPPTPVDATSLVTINTNPPLYAYVYAAYEFESTNRTHIVFLARATNTVTVSSPIPLLVINVEHNTDLTASNDWKHVDTFWMPLSTNDASGFYRIKSKFLK